MSMPMIDVYAAADLFPADADRQLAEELTAALLKAEGVTNPGPTHTNNLHFLRWGTGAYIHRMPASAVNTAAQGSARSVRVQIVTHTRCAQSGRTEAACRGSDADHREDRPRPDPGRANMGAADRGCRRRLGYRGHRVWERGVRRARREEEVALMMKIAVLDDYQGVALRRPTGRRLRDERRSPSSAIESRAPAIVERLLPFDIVCVMRERSPLPREVLERLPMLKLIASTGSYNSSIDTTAPRARFRSS
jgi:hypothetical protein